MLLCKMVAMVILHQFLSSGHIMPNVAMQKCLPWEIVINHLGQELKHHKSILYDEFMHLSIKNMKY